MVVHQRSVFFFSVLFLFFLISRSYASVPVPVLPEGGTRVFPVVSLPLNAYFREREGARVGGGLKFQRERRPVSNEEVNGTETAFYSFSLARSDRQRNRSHRGSVKVGRQDRGLAVTVGEKVMNKRDWREGVHFSSSQPQKKSEAIKLIDESIAGASSFLRGEGLEGGLREYLVDMEVSIEDEGDHYILFLAPRSGVGHDISFEVDKKTGTLDQESLVIGTLKPSPFRQNRND